MNEKEYQLRLVKLPIGQKGCEGCVFSGCPFAFQTCPIFNGVEVEEVKKEGHFKVWKGKIVRLFATKGESNG